MFGAGTQRLISLAIGALATIAVVMTLIFLFSTTQPHRAAERAAVLSDQQVR